MPAVEHWERVLPNVRWREPIQVEMQDGQGLACRVCIAEVGLLGNQTERLFDTREEFDTHFTIHETPESAA